MFSGLRENSILYILEKTPQGAILHEGVVVKEINSTNGYMPPLGMPKTEISVEVRVGEIVHKVEHLPTNQNLAERNGVIVSDSREAMYAEVKALERASDEYLSNVEYHTNIKNSCSEIYCKLDPQIAKDKATEERLSKLESFMGSLDGKVDAVLNALGKSGKPLKD